MKQKIIKLKKELTNDVVIMAHHYQKDEIVSYADVTGDSLELAQKIPLFKDKKFIIFCGVHFMAETASILAKENQTIILPDLKAGCFLADTATIETVESAWDILTKHNNEKIIPITYINSSASLKSFVGKNGGAICTSSNANKIISWALKQGEKLFFLPDQHLGRNTSFKLGIPLNQMIEYNATEKDGGLDTSEIENAKIILWSGYCDVHQKFTTTQIKNVRKNDNHAKIIVHPECPFDVVSHSDLNGSTSFIINEINKSTPDSRFAVGTEINLVNRLAKNNPDKTIYSLSPENPQCDTMNIITENSLLKALTSIKNNNPLNVIKVSRDLSSNALKALERMLTI